MKALASTMKPAERAHVARSTEADVHKAWHRIFGDDCRKTECRKEETSADPRRAA